MAPNGLFIETHDVCRIFRSGAPREVRAVDGISIEAPRGSVTALTGPSGSGKTTLLSLLGLLDRPTSGAVIVAGKDFTHCSDYERARCRRRMGFVFQDFALLPKRSAIDNICYPLIPRGIDRRERQRIARQWLDRLGLAAQASNRTEELSGGECQRVAIARALAGSPDVLLADEPTSNLDRDSGNCVLAALREFHVAGGTLVLCTHDSEVLSLATHVYNLQNGKLVSKTH